MSATPDPATERMLRGRLVVRRTVRQGVEVMCTVPAGEGAG